MGSLRVGAVVPVPPFTGVQGDAGLDVDLMTAIAEALGDQMEFIGYETLDAVFDALDAGDVDCVAGGVTVTPEREQKAAFAPPYVITGQALAVDARRHPQVHSTDDLDGLNVAVQRGSTAEFDIDEYDAVIALAPVLTELTRAHPGVDVVQKGLTVEHVAVAVAGHDQQLLSRITVALAELEEGGILQQIRRKWLGNPYADQSLAVH
ncbi:ABC transporter substrate-binding protein [Mycolicibacterium litorale]|uniref:ABC transporter substrate-binding protein n=1 Tax=Mycolicibacterium litorale TaxID=758802 RepID=UPI003CEE2AB6